MKERIGHIASVLENQLDHDFRVAAKQITMVLPPPLDPSKTDDDFGDFIFAPLGEFVVRHGLSKRHLKLSLFETWMHSASATTDSIVMPDAHVDTERR